MKRMGIRKHSVCASSSGLCAVGIVAHPDFPKEDFMYQVIKILVALWAWGSWAWVVYSHQWLWLLLSVVPYLLFNSFGHLLDRSEPKADAVKLPDENEVGKNA